VKILTDIRKAFRGDPRTLAAHAKALQAKPGILSGVRACQASCSPAGSSDTQAPIFLFSAGWRAGSTFVQRLIMSNPGVLIWGEPYDECGLIQAMADTMKAFRPDWPPKNYFIGERPLRDLPEEWVANLFPSADEWRHGHRALYDRMFAEPARQAGAERWGIKEVRLGADHAYYLRWLYPQARFVFLYRNPLDAYSSYCRYGRSWYDTYPDKPVFTASTFGSHWRRLVDSFLQEADALDAMLVRYEDLSRNTNLIKNIEKYLDVTIDQALVSKTVGTSVKAGKKPSVGKLDRWLLRRAVGPTARRLGYAW
jgi:hypothetical protein